MKVAMLAWEALHAMRVGGLAVAVTRLAEEIAKRGHEVHIFTRAAEGDNEFGCHNGVIYHRYRVDSGNNKVEFAHNLSKTLFNGVKRVEAQNGIFDIIHGHDWHVVQALDDLKKDNHKIVFTLHSTEYGRNGNNFSNWWVFKDISGKEQHGTYIADKVTTVSKSLKGEVQWLYNVPSNKIEIVRNGITPQKYFMKVGPGRIKEKYGIHPLAPTILFTGRLVYQKGTDLLVEAIPKILDDRWDAKFIIAGDGEIRDSLEQRVKDLKVDSAVRFPGFVDYWRYIELINACDIVCIPSRNEPFGLVLLEAWSTGRPCVVTDVGGLGEMVENFVDGIKVHASPESIAWGVNYLLNNPEEMKKISENCRRKVFKFTWDEPVEKLLNIYNSLLV